MLGHPVHGKREKATIICFLNFENFKYTALEIAAFVCIGKIKGHFMSDFCSLKADPITDFLDVF